MRVKMSKQPPPAPTESTIGPCPTVSQVSRTPWHWKFTQHLRTTRPPPKLRGSSSASFIFVSFLDRGQYFLMSRPHFGRVSSSCKTSQKDISLCKNCGITCRCILSSLHNILFYFPTFGATSYIFHIASV